MRLPAATVILTLLASLACSTDSHGGPTPPPPFSFTIVARDLASPVHLASPPADSRRFIVEQPGRIRLLTQSVATTPFLDLSAKVSTGGERGLLSVAFDPAFATNGHFFVYYTNLAGDITVERYTAAAGASVADPASATPVITIPHPNFANHNGGLVAFGPDGMLYIATGDGGSGGDPNGNAQNLTVLLGKLLRLDVHSLPYTIPASNPFYGQSSKRNEIWAYGLRNPWRYAWAPATDSTPARLFIADVGQDVQEEIDVVRADSGGVNFGWKVMEGTRCYAPASGCTTAGLALPAATYDHSTGACSIIGGPVYRGSIAQLRGAYFYSDYCASFVRVLRVSPTGRAEVTELPLAVQGNVLGFGEDAFHELYVLTSAGTVYKLVNSAPD